MDGTWTALVPEMAGAYGQAAEDYEWVRQLAATSGWFPVTAPALLIVLTEGFLAYLKLP